MESTKRQDISITSGSSVTPILANAKQSMVDELKPSQASIEDGQNVTKPVSVAEALSLWQTACFDLQSHGFKMAILARDNRVFLMFAPPASIGKISFLEGHFYIDGVPVSEL